MFFFDVTRSFFIIFRKTCQTILSECSWICSPSHHSVSIKFILILFPYLRLVLPSSSLLSPSFFFCFSTCFNLLFNMIFTDLVTAIIWQRQLRLSLFIVFLSALFVTRSKPSLHLTLWRLTTYIYIYICRTAELTYRRCILNIYSTNILTEYFKHAAHSSFFLFKMPFIS